MEEDLQLLPPYIDDLHYYPPPLVPILPALPRDVRTYGLVCYYQETDGRIVYHISQRRDTLAYIHFIRGCVSEEKLLVYFSRMTKEEKDRIQSYTFEELWIDLFTDSYQTKTNYFGSAKATFENYWNQGLIEKACQSTKDIDFKLDWGIPKGRKKHNQEPDLVCALREYREETRNKCYLEFLDNPPIECKLNTQTITYYIAKSKFKPKPKYVSLNFGNIRRESISEETNDLKWANLEEAKGLLSETLFQVLQEVSQLLNRRVTSSPRRFLVLQDVIIKYGKHLLPTSLSIVRSGIGGVRGFRGNQKEREEREENEEKGGKEENEENTHDEMAPEMENDE